MIGTWINVGAILSGSIVGLFAKKRVSPQVTQLVTMVIGLVTLVLGVQLAIETHNILILLLSLLFGGAIGTRIRIEQRLMHLGESLASRFPRWGDSEISQGLVSASLLFCVGPMAILGALRDGLYGDWHILGLKAVMDGISSMILASGLGPGVLFSSVIVLVYQGGISLIARAASGASTSFSFSESLFLAEVNAAGGVVLIALSLKLLDLRDVKAGNLVPALVIAPLLVFFFR
ncbi:MAG: DUF554 domain-containing protein [Candidatus Bipolaricaulota bacterium]